MIQTIFAKAIKLMMGPSTSEPAWQQKANAKRDAVLNLIPEAWRIQVPDAATQPDVTGDYLNQYLSEREIEITETDSDGIVKQTSTGAWSAEEVVKAFAHRAALAHQLVNCLHEIFFEAAIEDAKKLDAYYAKHKKPIGPMHGLPVSLKDQFHVKGVDTHMGYIGWIGTFQGRTDTGKEKVFESEMVKELRNLGAVLYVKTSCPQSLMVAETMNHVIGYTWNPKNRNLSSGGSSGGEGALMSLKGSPLGFGSDIGGSVRIPASFNGQYGMRPSGQRMPYEGMPNSVDGQNTLLSVVGPLSSSLGGLRLAIKSLLSQEPWLQDPTVLEIPWRSEQEQLPEQLVFGVMKDDGLVTPHPPIRRAVQETIRAVEAAGHKVMEWKPPSHQTGWDVGAQVWKFDGGEDVHSSLDLSGEPIIEQVVTSMGTERFPQANATDIMAANVAKRQYQKEYLDYWNSTADVTGTGRPVDALIMPIGPSTAALPNKFKWYGYSLIVSIVDYTAVVVPVTTVNKSIDVVDRDLKPLGMPDLDKSNAEDYDPELYHGSYVGLQVVGRRLQEEKTLAIAEVVDNALKRAKQVI